LVDCDSDSAVSLGQPAINSHQAQPIFALMELESLESREIGPRPLQHESAESVLHLRYRTSSWLSGHSSCGGPILSLDVILSTPSLTWFARKTVNGASPLDDNCMKLTVIVDKTPRADRSTIIQLLVAVRSSEPIRLGRCSTSWV
jgi:hypothetical protein